MKLLTAMKPTTFQRVSDYERWSRHPDFHFQAKTVGRFRIELFYGTERGGTVLIWIKAEKETEKLLYVWPRSDDETRQLDSEVNFWDYGNAQDEYRELRNNKDVIALMWRNR